MTGAGTRSNERSIPVPDLLALMRQNSAKHHRHYRKWTDEAGLENTVAIVQYSALSIMTKEASYLCI